MRNFRERALCEVRRIPIPRNRVNKGKKRKGPSHIGLQPFRLIGLITRHRRHHPSRRGQAVAGGSDGCQYVV
jgi:hypothetical protein